MGHSVVTAQGVGCIVATQHRRGRDVGVVIRGQHRHGNGSGACSLEYRAARLRPCPGIVLPGIRAAVEPVGIAELGNISEKCLDGLGHAELEVGLLGGVQFVLRAIIPIGQGRLIVGIFGIRPEQVIRAQLTGDRGQHRIAGAVQENLAVDGISALGCGDVDGGDSLVGNMHILNRCAGEDVNGVGQIVVVAPLQPNRVDGVDVAPLRIGFA